MGELKQVRGLVVIEGGEVLESLSSLSNNGITLLGCIAPCWPPKCKDGKTPIVDWVGCCGSFKSIQGAVEVRRGGCTDEVDKYGLKGGGSGWFIHAGPKAYVVTEALKGGEVSSKVCVGEMGAELIMDGLTECPSGRT